MQFSHEALSAPFSILLLVLCGVAGFGAWWTWVRERRIALGEAAVSLAGAAVLSVLGDWCSQGAVEGLLPSDCWAVAVVVAAGALVSFARRPMIVWLEDMWRPAAEVLRALRDVVLVVGTCAASAWIVDYVWLDTAAELPVGSFYATFLVLLAFASFLYVLGQRTGLLLWLVPVAAAGFGIAQHFVVLFKGAALLPSDLLAAGTAAAVAEGYEFVLTPQIAYGIMAAFACACALSFVWPGHAGGKRSAALNAGANLIVAAALAGVFASTFSTTSIEEGLGFSYDRWQPITTYCARGFVPSFIAVAQDLAVPEPEGYTEDGAAADIARLAAAYDAGAGSSPQRLEAAAQFEALKPTVIAVMDESFADLSIYDAVREAGYAGPQRFNGLADALVRGTLDVSVSGGGTANTEFEFLTGTSTAFLGANKIAYQLYDFSHVDSLAGQFDGLGYGTTAMHPQLGVNYQRTSVYREMGFGEFLDIDDFEGAPGYHAGATDAATFGKALEVLASDDAPQFVFDVTMQNHGGYDAGTVPEEDVVWYTPAGVEDEGLLTQLNTYLACIEASDRDLEAFIAQLRSLDRPVVLVYFGDHQPSVSTGLNDTLYPGEEPAVHAQRQYQTPYIVWANYDVAGCDQLSAWRETDPALLAAQTLHLIGAPLSEYQKAQIVLSEQVPAVHAVGYLGADGLRYALESEGPFTGALSQLERIQYYNFMRRVQ